ncbi:MAG: glycosyltransferase [Prevotellaceae bacterium]|nr:glycosyltransferase [Prevotellaceae bacterium]
MTDKTVSIIAPIYNEQRYISDFLNSILEQDYPHELTEVLLVDGMSSDGTRDIIADFTAQHPHFHLLDNDKRTVPYALNTGIKAAKGEVIVRIDAHCKYPKTYVSRLVKELFRLDADNVGGVWRTNPAKDTTGCHAIAIGSSHWFGVGNSAHKIGINTYKEVDTVPFGCYRRDVFDRIGLFDEELTRNQDDEFNARLINAGGKIFLVPIAIDYTARDSMCKMCKMYYQYGLFKPLVNKKLGHPATLRQFFPLLFVIGLILGIIMTAAYIATGYLFFNVATIIFSLVMLLYFGLGATIGFKHAKRLGRPMLTIVMPITFLLIHISYGFGYLKGIWKVVFNKDFNVKYNR